MEVGVGRDVRLDMRDDSHADFGCVLTCGTKKQVVEVLELYAKFRTNQCKAKNEEWVDRTDGEM